MFNWINYPFIKLDNLKFFSSVYPDINKNDWRYNYKIIHLAKSNYRCKECSRPFNKYIIDLEDMLPEYGHRYHIMMDIECPVCSEYYCK